MNDSATEKSDSRVGTYEHIQQFQRIFHLVIRELNLRLIQHDQTKLFPPEKEMFDVFTPKLANCTYGSDEYKGYLEALKPALDHHYKNNRHHAEYYEDGIFGMSLIDLIEMLCDWRAATMRHNDGDIMRSIELNQKRYKYSDELKRILINTLPYITPVKPG